MLTFFAKFEIHHKLKMTILKMEICIACHNLFENIYFCVKHNIHDIRYQNDDKVIEACIELVKIHIKKMICMPQNSRA